MTMGRRAWRVAALAITVYCLPATGKSEPALQGPIADLAQSAPSDGLAPLPMTSHWWRDIEAIPVGQSDAVVIGEVTRSRASVDLTRGTIQSQFTIAVSEILKDVRGTLVAGAGVTARRPGGIVRFADGAVQTFAVANQGWPERGGTYVLFLKRAAAGGAFDLLTGYELRDGVVFPLDGRDARGGDELPFHLYSGIGERGFRAALHDAVAAVAGARQ